MTCRILTLNDPLINGDNTVGRKTLKHGRLQSLMDQSEQETEGHSISIQGEHFLDEVHRDAEERARTTESTDREYVGRFVNSRSED